MSLKMPDNENRGVHSGQLLPLAAVLCSPVGVFIRFITFLSLVHQSMVYPIVWVCALSSGKWAEAYVFGEVFWPVWVVLPL